MTVPQELPLPDPVFGENLAVSGYFDYNPFATGTIALACGTPPNQAASPACVNFFNNSFYGSQAAISNLTYVINGDIYKSGELLTGFNDASFYVDNPRAVEWVDSDGNVHNIEPQDALAAIQPPISFYAPLQIIPLEHDGVSYNQNRTIFQMIQGAYPEGFFDSGIYPDGVVLGKEFFPDEALADTGSISSASLPATLPPVGVSNTQLSFNWRSDEISPGVWKEYRLTSIARLDIYPDGAAMINFNEHDHLIDAATYTNLNPLTVPQGYKFTPGPVALTTTFQNDILAAAEPPGNDITNDAAISIPEALGIFTITRQDGAPFDLFRFRAYLPVADPPTPVALVVLGLGPDDEIIQAVNLDVVSGMEDIVLDGFTNISAAEIWINNPDIRLLTFDKFVVTALPLQVELDVNPWSPLNEVRPDSNDFLTVGLTGLKAAAGDGQDFSPLQVDETTVSFGPAGAANIAAPLKGDFDGDGITDKAVAFNTQDTGIACGDTEVIMTGQTYTGEQFTATGPIETVDCESNSCHP